MNPKNKKVNKQINKTKNVEFLHCVAEMYNEISAFNTILQYDRTTITNHPMIKSLNR